MTIILTSQKLVETDGFEPPRFLGARFTVWCNQPLCHVSKISIGYLCVDKPLLGRLFIVRHFFVNVNVARSGFCNHPLRRPSVALRLRMEFLDNLVHDTRIELVFPPWKGSVLTDRRIVQITIWKHTSDTVPNRNYPSRAIPLKRVYI